MSSSPPASLTASSPTEQETAGQEAAEPETVEEDAAIAASFRRMSIVAIGAAVLHITNPVAVLLAVCVLALCLRQQTVAKPRRAIAPAAHPAMAGVVAMPPPPIDALALASS